VRWILPPHRQRSRRPGQRGQGLVEFSLVGGLFFFLVFSIVNAGFFLYGRGAVEHAADVGTATIAAEGDCTGAGGICAPIPSGCVNSGGTATGDQVAICRMDLAGLTTTPFIKVTTIYVYLIQQNANGTQVDSCNSSGTGTGSLPCNAAQYNEYDVYGNVISSSWPASSRNVSTGDANFGRLVINFQYALIATNQTFSESTSNVFRLEPQQ
jgi:hypothetical protein